MRNILLFLVMVAVVATIAIFEACKPKKPPVKPVDGSIRGFVFADVTSEKSQSTLKPIFLPGVTVEIKDSAGNLVDNVKTDFDGSFITKRLKKGKHKVCLSKNGFALTCHDVNVSELINHPGPLKINYDSRDYLYGTVKLKDSLPGFYRQEGFRIAFHTDIKADDGRGTVIEDVCNTFGEYLLMGVKQKMPYTITAKCQNAGISQNIVNNTRVAHFILPNTTPVIKSITAYNAGTNNSVLRTRPGQVLTLKAQAEDKENHPLNYKWVAMEKSSGLVSQNSSSINWSIPNIKGTYTVYAVVTDEHGGVAYKKYTILAGNEQVIFTGTVKDISSNAAIDGALVKINGTALARTDSKGYFSVSIPQGSRNRYVLNIEKLGYSLSSTIYHNDGINKTYMLVPSTTETFDPKNDIVITEKPDKYTRFTDDRQKNTRVAARVRIKGGSIVDSLGNKVNTDVTVSLRTIDLFDPRGLMPGDFGAEQGGQQKILESYGAIDVQIRDKANPEIKYNLKGKKAEINVPIFSSIQASSPASMTLWDYDEKRGLWVEIGNANKNGNIYAAETDRFSALNVDVAFNDAACIVLEDNPNRPVFTGSTQIDIRVTVPGLSGGAPKIKYFSPITALPQVIVRLPANTDIKIDVIRNGQEIRTHTVNTGTGIPGPANLDPAPPYTGCKTVFILPDAPLPANPGQVFLNRLSNNETDANKYYNLIGAFDANNDGTQGDTINFTQWRTRNFFDANNNSLDDASAIYFNAGDLGFWRGMHQKTQGSNIAYYVSNFLSDTLAISGSGAFATVCMEYSPITSGGNPVTKFYVFDGAGKLTNNADLDGYGPKFIPGLCLVCHGGEFDASLVNTPAELQTFYDDAGANPAINPRPLNPKFLPFDLVSFIYSSSPGYSRANQEDSLRQLNNAILPMQTTQAIRNFINAHYSNTPGTANTVYDDNAFVGGWSSNVADAARGNVVPRSFYTNVYGPSCRTCHVTRTNPELWFDSSTKFTNNVFSGAVCGTNKYMPNAKTTFINFWNSIGPYRPEEVRKYLNISSCE